jgi:steroid delta-isomerase-like uncharacterized protein
MLRFVDEVCNEGKLGTADVLLSAGYLHHDPRDGKAQSWRPSISGVIAFVRTAFPDLHVLVDDLISEGNELAIRWTASGTHLGATPGIAATGKRAVVTGVTIARFQGELIAEDWTHWDHVGVLKQLGLLPTDGSKPARGAES